MTNLLDFAKDAIEEHESFFEEQGHCPECVHETSTGKAHQLAIALQSSLAELDEAKKKLAESEAGRIWSNDQLTRIAASIKMLGEPSDKVVECILARLEALERVRGVAKKNHAQGGCEDCGGCCACDTELLSALADVDALGEK